MTCSIISLAYMSLSLSSGGNIVGYSLTYFIPTILKGFKYSPIQTQLHSVPPFAAAYVFSLIISFASARARHRFTLAFFPLLIALAGVGILLNVHTHVKAEYAGVFLITMGLFGSLPVALCWYIMNLEGHFGRAIGSAWMIGCGNIGGIVATFSFESKDAPFYHKGYSIVTFGLCLAAACSIGYGIGCFVENRRKGGLVGWKKLQL